jgi:thioredoxin-related protein
MKKFFLLSILTVALLNNSIGQVPSADKLLSAAYATASKQNKKTLIIFHASWCSWCKKFDASLNHPDCKKIFEDNYVIVHLDVNENVKNKNLENKGASDYLMKYNGDKAGLPYFIVVDEQGELIADSYIRNKGQKMREPGENIGCPATAEEVASFCKMLKGTSNLNDDQLKIITKVFRKNEQ